MLKNIGEPEDLRQLLLALLSASGTLAGLSMALVGIVNLKIANASVGTIADDMFLFASLGFLIVCFLIFFTLRLRPAKAQRWTYVIDCIFLLSLALLVAAGFVVLYASF
jgi:glucan phosphoethanolaminetransferase (alkaline phosphatase superfamily)